VALPVGKDDPDLSWGEGHPLAGHRGERGAGGRVQYAWSAAAPLVTRLGHFFRGCGVNVLEGYGLTETSLATNSNTLDAQRIGTVGRCGRVSSGPVCHSACDGGTECPTDVPHGDRSWI